MKQPLQSFFSIQSESFYIKLQSISYQQLIPTSQHDPNEDENPLYWSSGAGILPHRKCSRREESGKNLGKKKEKPISARKLCSQNVKILIIV